jgi:SAM-dependent methyltransferase
LPATTTNHRAADRISQWFRDKRARHLKELLLKAKIPGQPLRVIDLGGRYSFWQAIGLDFLRDNAIEITILNLSHDETGRPPESESLVQLAIGNACSLDMEDGAFDAVVSNSVIEHLGTWQNMIDFAATVRRLGKVYYCQTPNFWFPVDPHYFKMPLFHFFPRPARAWLLRTFPIATVGRIPDVVSSFHVVDAARLLSRTQMAALFPSATLRAERVLGLFVKSYTAVGQKEGKRL